MCTYNISINDSVMEDVRPAFADEEALSLWMQQQMELMLIKFAASLQKKKTANTPLSSRLRGIACAPKDFDYKKELANRYEV